MAACANIRPVDTPLPYESRPDTSSPRVFLCSVESSRTPPNCDRLCRAPQRIFGNLRGNRSVSSGAPRREGDPRGAVQTGTAGPKFLGLPRSRPVTYHADRPPRRAATRAIRRTRLFSGGEEPCSLFGSLRRDGSLVRSIFLMVAAPTREPSLVEPDQKVARDHHPRGSATGEEPHGVCSSSAPACIVDAGGAHDSQ